MWDEWIIAAERVVFADRTAPGWVHVRGGVIAGTGTVGDPMPDGRLHYVGQRVVLPGLVDSHVHVNQPGRTTWEGFETATLAAAMGGTTTLVDMPLNSVPVTTTPGAFDEKWKSADAALVDVAFWGGAVPDNVGMLGALAERGVCGFKAFLTHSGIDEFGWLDRDLLAVVAAEVADLGLPLLAHAEDATILAGPGDAFSTLAPNLRRAYKAYLDSRPSEAEDVAIAALIDVAAQTGASVHVLHVASGDAVALIATAQAAGVAITAETCPHYLMFTAADVADGATLFKCAPPIREDRHRLALWQGLIDGTISMVVSDHSPAPPDLKAIDTGDFGEAWGGISSLELRLPVVWTAGQAFSIRLEDLAAWLSAAPADLAGLGHRKGRLAPGYDADIVVFDPNDRWIVDAADLSHRHPISAYHGIELLGRVTETFLRGWPVTDADARMREPMGTRLTR